MTKTTVFKLLRNGLITLVGLAAVVYLGAMIYLYVNQRHLLYYQVQGHETPDVAGVPIEDVSLKTPDGETLEAWYEAPKPGRPVILFLHGNASSLERGRYRYIRMHSHGVGYLALAYRGYSGSTGTPTEKGLLTDSLTAYDWLRAKGFKDSDIVIHGHSLGTGVGTWLATQRPAHALILEAPFTAASDVGAHEYPYMPVALLMHDKFLSRERIKDVHMPVLIVHGDHDKVIPFAEGEHLFALANAPKTFVHMAGSNHNTLTHDGVYIAYWKFLGVPENDTDSYDRDALSHHK